MVLQENYTHIHPEARSREDVAMLMGRLFDTITELVIAHTSDEVLDLRSNEMVLSLEDSRQIVIEQNQEVVKIAKWSSKLENDILSTSLSQIINIPRITSDNFEEYRDQLYAIDHYDGAKSFLPFIHYSKEHLNHIPQFMDVLNSLLTDLHYSGIDIDLTS